MMFEELVKRMRFKTGFKSVYDSVYDEAADAIEELDGFLCEAERDRDEYRERLDKTNDILLNRWIPVTERLPEKDCHVLAYYGFDHGDGYLGMMFMQVLDYYANDPKPHFQHEGMNGMKVTHWMPLPEPPKEEA